MKVIAFKIQYKDNNRVWTVKNVQNYAEHGIVESYSAETAPKVLELSVSNLDEAEMKKQIEEITGLEVETFNYTYNMYDHSSQE